MADKMNGFGSNSLDRNILDDTVANNTVPNTKKNKTHPGLGPNSPIDPYVTPNLKDKANSRLNFEDSVNEISFEAEPIRIAMYKDAAIAYRQIELAIQKLITLNSGITDSKWTGQSAQTYKTYLTKYVEYLKGIKETLELTSSKVLEATEQMKEIDKLLASKINGLEGWKAQ